MGSLLEASWSEFAQNVSGEWDGFGADFSGGGGEPLELPESVVPEAYREWEVKVFDWQTQCTTLADAHSFLYKCIKLYPTVGCEADAPTRYSVDERSIATALAFSYSVSGSYVALWPLGKNQLEVEHCLFNPNDKESRVRVFQVIRLAESSEMLLQSVRVFCELWYGPFRDGDQLGGCAIRNSAFASTPTTSASMVSGSWRALLATTSFHASEGCCCIQQVAGEKVIDIVREEKHLLLLPKDLWCSLQQGSDGEREFSLGWLFEPGHAITSTCVFSSDSKLKEVTMGRETARSHV